MVICVLAHLNVCVHVCQHVCFCTNFVCVCVCVCVCVFVCVTVCVCKLCVCVCVRVCVCGCLSIQIYMRVSVQNMQGLLMLYWYSLPLSQQFQDDAEATLSYPGSKTSVRKYSSRHRVAFLLDILLGLWYLYTQHSWTQLSAFSNSLDHF